MAARSVSSGSVRVTNGCIPLTDEKLDEVVERGVGLAKGMKVWIQDNNGKEHAHDVAGPVETVRSFVRSQWGKPFKEGPAAVLA